MFLCKVLHLVVYIQLCASQDTFCSDDLTLYWSNNWNVLSEYKKIYFALSRSTNAMVANFQDLLDVGIEIVTPIIFRPFESSETYELAVLTSGSTDNVQNLNFVAVFKGNLTLYGNYREKSNCTDYGLMTYVFETQDVFTVNCVTLLQACQMTMTAMEQISVEKALILFVSVSAELLSKRIFTNLTAYIESAEMQEYRFFEFGVEHIDSCEVLKKHLMKCKAEKESTDVDTFIVSAFLLLVVSISAAKSIRCIREIRSNRVHDICELRF